MQDFQDWPENFADMGLDANTSNNKRRRRKDKVEEKKDKNKDGKLSKMGFGRKFNDGEQSDYSQQEYG